MEELQELLDLTKKIEKMLDGDSSSDNRGDHLANVQNMLERRGRLLEQIEPPFSDDEHEIGRQAVAINNRVKQKMDQQFAELKQAIKQVKQQKKSSRSYINPYAQVQTADGLYMDRRN